MKHVKVDPNITRRKLLGAGAGLATIAALGCDSSNDGNSNSSTGTTGAGGTLSPDGGTANLDAPEVSSQLWQTMAAYVRADADAAIGSRVNLYNPSEVTQRVVVQVFDMDGKLVAKEELSAAFAPGKAEHLDVGTFLSKHGVALPFAGSMWVGTTPKSGKVFMGLQGIVYDWYGPTYLASVHGMRDIGNSNGDTMWTDLILPKLTVTDRFVSKVAIHNASGDGVSEALDAKPEIIVRSDDGVELVHTTLEAIPPYCTVLVDAAELLGSAAVELSSIQIREPEAGLVALGFVHDNDNGGFATADHFFDRHFVAHGLGFTG